MTPADDPADDPAREASAAALIALYDGANLRACDVPRFAWARLLSVITIRTTPPRSAAVQARMDALAESIAKETT